MVNDATRRLRWELFALSFTALFLELTMIRWVPSVVHLVAYYANLIGAMCGGFCEYLGMAIGNHWLCVIVLAAYLGSMLTLRDGTARPAA